MYSLLLQVLVMVVATNAASITAHSRHKRVAPSCHLHPTNYDYQDAQNQTSQSNLDNCNLHDVDTTDAQYMDCVTPALLTDGQYGPDNHSSTEHYYIAQDGRSFQILFTFPNIETVKDIVLYYYSNVTGNQSLPRVAVYIVNDDFNVWDNPTKSWINEVGPSNAPTTQAGLRQEKITVNSASRKWLLRFHQLEHQFYLSEVAFFSCTLDPPTIMAPLDLNTQVQKFTSTPYSAMPDTRPEISTHTSTDIITQTTDTVQVSHEQSSTQSDFLPWLLMGIMTVLFCALLSINIICCIVCLLKKHKKRRYQLKRNPSYASSPRTLSAHNTGFENHIYDFIQAT